MRQIREVLRLKMEARMSHQQIAAATRLSKGAVANYVKRAVQASLGWPLPEELDDAALERLLFPQFAQSGEYRQQPDCGQIHKELNRKGVTLQLLWEEYRDAHGEQAYRYSQFCAIYKKFRKTLARSMRQIHLAGEKDFIDYSGQRMPVIDAETGEIRQAEIFISSMGASKYTYAEATWTQTLPDWIESHKRMFVFLGAVPWVLVPDNLKSAINKACRYEPEANSTYNDMANHFGCVIIPARPRKPKDKAIVESHVQVVQRWILARLRNRTFFSLHELNAAIAELLPLLNNRRFKKLPGTRASTFREIDLPAMKPLPAQPYEYAEFKGATVNSLDYHVEADGHYYSCPHQLAGEHVQVRMTAYIVECFFKGRRVASHVRSHLAGKHSTLPEHMPQAHKRHAQWTPSRLLSWGAKIGQGTRNVIQWQLENRPHPEQGYRACLGLLNLSKTFGEQRLEAACRRALSSGGDPTRKRIKAILDANLDQHPDLFGDVGTTPTAPTSSRSHENVRGAQYFSSTTQPDACVVSDADTDGNAVTADENQSPTLMEMMRNDDPTHS
jgi:transposase